MTKSLWPDNIEVTSDEVAPVSILKEQATLLGEKTQNLVIAEVDTSVRETDNTFINTFYLVAPALNNYRYKLFSLSHGIEQFYPLKLVDSLDMQKYEISSKDALLERLTHIFSHPKTVRIIHSLLIQSGWTPEGATLVTF